MKEEGRPINKVTVQNLDIALRMCQIQIDKALIDRIIDLVELIENDKIVLMGRLTMLLDMIKETFRDNTKSENELIELYSNVDMIIIDDLGTEKISQWALEKLYTIIENRNENGLPIIITTRFDKQGLIERFSQSQDEQLVDAIISKLYQMCYGITLKNIKEKASTSDQTKC